MKYIAIILVTVIATIVARPYVSSYFFPPSPRFDQEPIEVVPKWIGGGRPCTPMNEDERAKELRTLDVLREFPRAHVMHIAAERHFGLERYRKIDDRTTLRLCPPADLDEEIATTTLKQGTFNRSHLFTEELNLARRLGPRDPKIVQGTAGTAFNPHPIRADWGAPGDIRNLARVVLAEFGAHAAPWATQAFNAISIDDPYGTTAAQIALAGGHPQAAARIATLLDEILQKHSRDPIPRTARNRFYDLAYALAILGPAAEPHAQPVTRIMSRKVQSWAPPFGMVELAPRRMCRVLELIGGPGTEQTLASAICRPMIDTWEQ